MIAFRMLFTSGLLSFLNYLPIKTVVNLNRLSHFKFVSTLK